MMINYNNVIFFTMSQTYANQRRCRPCEYSQPSPEEVRVSYIKHSELRETAAVDPKMGPVGGALGSSGSLQELGSHLLVDRGYLNH